MSRDNSLVFVKPRHLIAVITLMCVSNLVSHSRVNAAKPNEVLFLQQAAGKLGNAEVDIAPNAVKVYLEKYKLHIVAKAPKWKVTSFVKSSKQACELPLKQWLVSIAQYGSSHPSIQSTNPAHKSSCRVAGLPCTKWVISHNGEQVHPSNFEIRTLDQQTLIFYNNKVDPNIVKLLEGLYSLPTTDQLALQYSYVYKSSTHINREMISTKASKLIPADSHMFDTPTGYKPVALTQLLILGSAQQTDIKELIDGVGIGSPKY